MMAEEAEEFPLRVALRDIANGCTLSYVGSERLSRKQMMRRAKEELDRLDQQIRDAHVVHTAVQTTLGILEQQRAASDVKGSPEVDDPRGYA